MPPRIELVSGPAPSVRIARNLACLVSALGLLFSGAEWPWVFASLLALAASWLVSGRQAARGDPPGRLVLHLDGQLQSYGQGAERHGVSTGAAWVSRWFCVLTWVDNEGGRRRNVLVCASGNHPDDYRRLLAWSRLGAFGEGRTTA